MANCKLTFARGFIRNVPFETRHSELMAAYDSGQPLYVINVARDFVRDFPDHWPAWIILGGALKDLARYREARQTLLRGISLTPLDKRRVPYCEMGHLCDEKGDFEKAASWYRRAIKADPNSASSYIYLGAVLAKGGQLDRAEKVHRRATKCPRGNREEAYLNLGFVLRAQERLQQALRCFRKAIKLDPDYNKAKLAIGDLKATQDYLHKSNGRRRSKARQKG